jgi:hypothetical protein
MAEGLVRTQQELENAPEEELDRGIDALGGLYYSAHAHLLAFIAAKDARDPDSRATVVGLSARMGISIAQARRWIETARLLRDLPHLAELYESGSLSYEKLEAIARVATPETDESLAEAAPTMSVGAIRKLAAKLDRVKDPEQALAAGRLRYRWGRNGRFRFSGDLPAAEGDLFAKAIEREMDTMPRVPDEERPSYDQRAADALVNLASARIADDADADRATVVVHADLSVLTDGEGVAESEFGSILHPDVVRRLACDCRMQVTAHDHNGRSLGVGRTQRTAPPWLMRQLKKRDVCCSFPGCTNRRFTEGHHVTFWPDGGRTDLDDMSLLCRYHHKLVHEGKWKMELVDPDTGETKWYRPDGSLYSGGPPPIDEELRKRFFGPLVPAG